MEIIAGLATALIVLGLLFKPIFDDIDGFGDCVRFWLTPDIWSWMQGEGYDDWWAEMKLFAWLLLGGGAGFGVFSLLT